MRLALQVACQKPEQPTMITVYQVTQFGKPCGEPRKELGETLPRHADMLRYDSAFHDPNDLSRVIFPVFKHAKDGSTSQRITFARWDSFLMKLQAVDETSPLLCMKWITFQHPVTDTHGTHYDRLVPQTLEQYMMAGKYKLASNHR